MLCLQEIFEELTETWLFARTSGLLKRIKKTHETITILRYGKPIASIVPFEDINPEADKYPLRGIPIHLADDFDEPLTELWDAIK